jgi:hypothetical protein
MGSVLDVYWHFSEPGDRYLDCILARLDPKKSSFATLPPHWTPVNPLENELVALAMDRLYGQIMARYKNTLRDLMAMLLLCLACIVYHPESILATMVANPS